MDIDLLFTDAGAAGLIANGNLIKKVAGILLDTVSGMMTVEFVDMDSMDLNIPIQSDFFSILDRNTHLHIGAVKDGNIGQAYQVPLMFLDDPYRADALGAPAKTSRNPLMAFERFVKNCTGGQPAHRDDLGDEDALSCVLGDSVPSSLQFAPHLARRQSLEAAPQTPAPLGPSGPSAPGLGGSGGGGQIRRSSSPPRRPRNDGGDNA